MSVETLGFENTKTHEETERIDLISSEVIDDVPTQDELERTIAFFESHPELIPEKLVFRAIRRLITDHANKAMVTDSSELELYWEKHPEENFILHSIVEAYALANGLRLIDDGLISKSIREGRALNADKAKRSWLGRVVRTALNLDTKETTALIKEYERLAAEVVSLENEKLKAKEEALSAKQEARDAINKATEKAETIKQEALNVINEATEKAETILQRAKLEAQKRSQEVEERAISSGKHAVSEAQAITLDAGARSERMLKDTLTAAESVRRDSVREVEGMRNKIEELEREIIEKKALLQELNNNPDVVKEWARRKNTGKDRKEMEEKLMKSAGVLKVLAKYPKTYCSEYGFLLETQKLMRYFKENILEPILAFEKKFGNIERAALCVAIENKVWANDIRFDYRLGMALYRFSTDFFNRQIKNFMDPYDDSEHLVKVFDASFKQFIYLSDVYQTSLEKTNRELPEMILIRNLDGNIFR